MQQVANNTRWQTWPGHHNKIKRSLRCVYCSNQSLHHSLQENSAPPSRYHHHCYNLHEHAGSTHQKKKSKLTMCREQKKNSHKIPQKHKFTIFDSQHTSETPIIRFHACIYKIHVQTSKHTKTNDLLENNNKSMVTSHKHCPLTQAACGPDTALTPYPWVRVRAMFTNPG